MLLRGNDQDPYDPEAYLRAHDEIVQLTRRLSQRTVRTLADEVVKRLSHRMHRSELALATPTSDQIDTFSRALVAEDSTACMELLTKPRSESDSLEMVFDAYLAPAARRLGEWWENDEMSFTEVTIGVGRIYAIMRSMRDEIAAPPYTTKYAVFAAVPGEHHSLGVTMASQVFQQHGWNIDLFVGLEHDELVERIVATGTHAIGLSASAERHVAALVRLIVALRVSLPSAVILVGGPIVGMRHDILSATGTDVATTDLDEALAALEQAWAKHADG